MKKEDYIKPNRVVNSTKIEIETYIKTNDALAFAEKMWYYRIWDCGQMKWQLNL